ncbi:MAG: phosphotransferase [Vicinamibacterales bacterium]
MLATPRFRASGHVIFLVLADWLRTPILVGKVPRLAADNGGLAREAANLRMLQTIRSGGFDSVPQVVAYEDGQSWSLLLETAVIGTPVDLWGRRRSRIDEVVDWLIEFHTSTMRPSETVRDWYTRLADEPCEQFLTLLPGDGVARHLIDRTSCVARALYEEDVPLVFEHRDFCPLNILVDHDGAIGVVDWELGEPDGLPALDLFFFLTAAAFARDGAGTEKRCLAAFRTAFFGPTAWARPHISRYANRVGLSADLLKPLFILCWSRHVTTLARRLHSSDGAMLGSETVGWLRSNRYYALWNYAVVNYHDLNLYAASACDATHVA